MKIKHIIEDLTKAAFFILLFYLFTSCTSEERDPMCIERDVFINLMIDRRIEEQPERETELEIKRDSLLAVPCKIGEI